MILWWVKKKVLNEKEFWYSQHMEWDMREASWHESDSRLGEVEDINLWTSAGWWTTYDASHRFSDCVWRQTDLTESCTPHAPGMFHGARNTWVLRKKRVDIIVWSHISYVLTAVWKPRGMIVRWSFACHKALCCPVGTAHLGVGGHGRPRVSMAANSSSSRKRSDSEWTMMIYIFEG